MVEKALFLLIMEQKGKFLLMVMVCHVRRDLNEKTLHGVKTTMEILCEEIMEVALEMTVDTLNLSEDSGRFLIKECSRWQIIMVKHQLDEDMLNAI